LDPNPVATRPDWGVLGLGRFGSLAARHLRRLGETWGCDPRRRRPRGVRAASFAEVCRARRLVLAVPIREIPEVLRLAAPYLRPGTLVADTASVKVAPCRWMEELLPPEVEILGTHPLFGPDSAARGLRGHTIALVPVRLRDRSGVERFLRGLGLVTVWCSAEEHDRRLAHTQALVHFLGRALEGLDVPPGPLETAGWRALRGILRYVSRDTRELFEDMHRLNPYAAPARARLLEALEALDRSLGGPHPE
jgi:prephenate dehydrogenase